MINYIRAIALIILLSIIPQLKAQDTERPLPPVLDLVSVDPFSGNTMLQWTAGGSADIAGYVIYLYLNEEGYAIDTIYDPIATSYTNTESNASFFPESYVIAAIDSSDNVSPLSNFLNTIFLEVKIDTCGNSLNLTWNRYLSIDPSVNEYQVYFSRDGSPYNQHGQNPGNDTSYIVGSFESYSEYCFFIEAVLSNGSSSFSNKRCVNTDLPVPPGWINANFASYQEEGTVLLSFTVDPLTEYEKFRIERSSDTTAVPDIIYEGVDNDGLIDHIDDNPTAGTGYYRLAALNSCNEPVVYSNYASTINLSVRSSSDEIQLNWNSYYRWRGGISTQRIYRNNDGVYREIAIINGTDTSYSDSFDNFIYETLQKDICYRIVAEEGINPYTADATSISAVACIEQPLKVFVPNAFTPDGNSVNEQFKPVLSFSPSMYRMIIKNRAGITLFETDDYLEGWDGKHGNRKLPEDVYIWFIEAETPEGKTITKTGTVTIIFNQDVP